MYSKFDIYLIVTGVIIIFAFLKCIKSKRAHSAKIARLNGIIESQKREIDNKNGIIKDYQKKCAQIKAMTVPENSQVNFRKTDDTAFSSTFVATLEQKIDSLTDQLKEKDQIISSLRSSVSSSKVEFADYSFLMQELGEKNKRISQLLAEVAPLNYQIKQLQEKIDAQEDAVQQLDYLRSIYPQIEDILVMRQDSAATSNHDYTRDFLSQKEWNELSDSQRDQRALDNYIKSHKKTKWQIGRDYELYVAHKYRQQGYDVDPCGSYLKLEDMGRDLILRKGDQVRIVQCKYWAAGKEINERFIFLLYGAVISYCIEKNLPQSLVKGIFVTNINLSDMAKKCANALGIIVMEKYPMGEFPRIKCNVTKDEYGEYVYIYHLPMDPQYDRVKIKNDRECYAYTVDEAESYGFCRAQK